MGRYYQMITASEMPYKSLSLKLNLCSPLKQNNPFGLTLVVPKSLWCDMSTRNDPLDADFGVTRNSFDHLLTQIDGKILKNVVHFHEFDLLSERILGKFQPETLAG
ncbi:hypothetical protein Bpfe_031536 [Biomphalaria pfeifferi]|uniref:Uncharacterized protein n=1 Tax=Biomphalaria pfeifferi TaxID=112525 RepID=A0AAD8ANQ5_BIOPF|nr:hypothetical protein Bpfe_031536 [Biomphalaria pfeifferi]